MSIGAPVSPTAGGGIPSGAIMENDDDGAALPTGFVLCDGANGTPDLRGRYVKGASGTGDEGTTGGANTVTLTTSELASHTHNPADHSPDLNADTSGGGSQTDPQGNTSGAAGGGSAHQNQPAFTELRYMMKT